MSEDRLDAGEPVDQRGGRGAIALAALCYLVFIVYGSLVPLDYRPRSLDAAWQSFHDIRYLKLGIGSRADWVANILLYIPLAFLLCAALVAGCRSVVGRVAGIAVVFAFCGALAVGVEFTQLFFPPRTVSLNDILAEFIGSALGIVLWLAWGGAIARLWAEMQRGGRPAMRAAVVAYVLAYLAMGLFPYDFVVSAREFAEKFAGRNYGVLFAPGHCTRVSDCAGKLIAETVAVIPLGVLIGMVAGKGAAHAYRTAALVGLVLGLVLELAQLMLASGVSEGMSVLARIGGMTIGVWVHRHVRLQSLARVAPWIAPALLAAIPLYLLALMWANAWFSAGWVNADKALAKLDQVRWLPFYYHYYTTETHAVRSFLAVTAMYLPIGFVYWLWQLRGSHSVPSGPAWVPALVAAPLALAMEMGKLFVTGKQPDPTDVPIAMVAAAAAYVLARLMHRWALEGESAPRVDRTGASTARSATTDAEEEGMRSGKVAAMLLLSGAGLVLWPYPLGGAWLALALAAWGAMLWRAPGITLPAVLALLPVLNFSSWTGWTLFNEYDLFLAVTLAVRLLGRSKAGEAGSMVSNAEEHGRYAAGRLTGGARLAIAFLALAFFASALVGLWPLPAFDASALTSYHNGFNSLVHFKGFAWALALLPLLQQESRDGDRFEARLSTGMLAGLCAVVAIVLWERVVFAGLWDFTNEYRAEGPFPELHTGGGDIHAYLVLALPFVVGWIALRPSVRRVAAGAALFMLASYALGVTFTRGGYIGYIGAVGILAAAVAMQSLRRGERKIWRVATAALLVGTGIAVLVPILSGPFMEARIAGTRTEAGKRTGNWARAIDMMDGSVTTALFGMGLGSFPRTLLFRDPDAASATFDYVRDGSNAFLRLGSGRPLFLGQRVAVRDGERYTLTLDLRSADAQAQLGVHLCERSAQQSFRCVEMLLRPRDGRGSWERQQGVLATGEVGSGLPLLRRPVVLSFSNGRKQTVIDVDNVRLLDAQGNDLLANGDFSRGGARWAFSADDHLPWHIFNLYVQVLFELGWVGVLAFTWVVGLSLWRLASATARGDSFAASILAALVGFLLIGLTESLLDGPRVAMLYFLLLFAGLLRPAAHADASRVGPPRVAPTVTGASPSGVGPGSRGLA